MPKKGQRPEATIRNQGLTPKKVKYNPFTPMSSLLGAAFSLVTFFWRPKESNQRKGPGYAAVPKIALHSVAQNKLALNAWLLPDYL